MWWIWKEIFTSEFLNRTELQKYLNNTFKDQITKKIPPKTCILNWECMVCLYMYILYCICFLGKWTAKHILHFSASPLKLHDPIFYHVFSYRIQPARSSPVAMPNARPAYKRMGSDNTPPAGKGQTTSSILIEAGEWFSTKIGVLNNVVKIFDWFNTNILWQVFFSSLV